MSEDGPGPDPDFHERQKRLLEFAIACFIAAGLAVFGLVAMGLICELEHWW